MKTKSMKGVSAESQRHSYNRKILLFDFLFYLAFYLDVDSSYVRKTFYLFEKWEKKAIFVLLLGALIVGLSRHVLSEGASFSIKKICFP